jgi:hypothetical protein
MLSKKSLELLQALFAENSNLTLPVGLSEQAIEVKKWVAEELKKTDAKSA